MFNNRIYNPAPIPSPIPYGKSLWDYKLGNYRTSWLEVYYEGEWIKMPQEAVGSVRMITTTVVNAGRNAKAEVIGEQIGRTQSKIDGYKIPFLYAHEWSRILKIFQKNLRRKVRYFDQEAGRMITRMMYVSDRSATPFAYKKDGRVEIWQNCELHLIDCGTED